MNLPDSPALRNLTQATERPAVHFSPHRHWINDPNGLIWHEGEYHLFFQHNPFEPVWGHMSWGHAVSSDLLSWTELPVAIAEDEQASIFSGSVVVDHANTCGLGDGDEPPMVALYTAAARRPSADGGYRQTQCLAWSRDRGRTWTKHPANPVLDLGSNSFRDPKVFWHAATRRWVMLVSLADEGCLRFYTATDLLHWSQTSEFCPELPGCKVWECPDLIPLPVPGEPGALAWLLKVDVFEGHPSGGSGALGWIGDFDGQCFVPRQARRWLDGGRDFYAALSFGAMPPGDERRVWLAWMNDHRYAKHTPTAPWRGAMTLPRELALQRAADGALRLLQQPLGALAARRDAALPLNLPTALPAIGVGLYTLAPAQLMPAAYELDIQLTFDTTPAAPPDAPPAAGWSLQLLASADEATVLAVDPVRGELAIDRRRSGWTTVEGAYAGRHALPWPGAQQRVQRLRVIVDTCSVEVFAGAGEAVLTELVFPAREARALRLQVDAPLRALSATLWPLRSA